MQGTNPAVMKTGEMYPLHLTVLLQNFTRRVYMTIPSLKEQGLPNVHLKNRPHTLLSLFQNILSIQLRMEWTKVTGMAG